MANKNLTSCWVGIAVALAGCSLPLTKEAGGGGGGGGGAGDVDGGAGADASGSASDAGSGSAQLDCTMRPPPTGWNQLTSGHIQNYGDPYYYFDIADSTKYANMFGFNDRAAPVSGTIITSPYTEEEGPPTAIDRPVFPARPATNAVYGYGPQKNYYALAFTAPTFPDASGATSLVEYMTGSSSNHGTVTSMSLSECPGDFSPDLGACLNEKFFGEGVNWGAEAGAAADSTVGMDPHLCHLTPGQTYYLNMAPSAKGDWTQSSCTEEWCWTTLIIDEDECPGAPDNDCNLLIQGL